MSRNMYGATSADFTLTSGGRVVPGSVLTIWSARTGGTQITDLLDVNSAACTTVTSAADGSVVYYGPNNDKDTHWAQASQGSRIAIRPVNITGETGATPALTVGTVTTGTAAATLTGTDEDPVLNLVLPSAGANGVNTAAIQDGAVTAAKIANDTITAAQIAANAVGSSELADNAVDTAAIADSAVTSAKIADGTIATGDLADGAVTPAKLATTGRFTFPTGAANGYGFVSGAVHLSGTGTPEGVVTAAPGSTYLQTDATNDVKGWIRWVKATGTGSTGWVAGPEADTGWRNVTDRLTAAIALSNPTMKLYVRRQTDLTTWRIVETSAGSATGTKVLVSSAIAGFMPSSPGSSAEPQRFGAVFSYATGLLVTTASLDVGVNDVAMFGMGAYPAIVEVTFPSAGTFPASFPGTPA